MKSKIQFHRVWAKNFRSVDNMGMELLYGDGNTMVASLDNGAGKSTMLVHALYYALFDKPYGKGNTKSGMINSRSNKDCVVEVEFTANGSLWKIRRGQKPTVFDIYKDGVRIEDEAALKDYQTNIPKLINMDEKVFNNTAALGRDKFVPFCSMSAPDRRAYGEQMLDVTIFSQMNAVNKEEMKISTMESQTIKAEIAMLEVKINSAKQMIDLKKQNAQGKVDELEQQLAAETTSAKVKGREITLIEAQIKGEQSELVPLQEQQTKRMSAVALLDRANQKIASKQAEIDSFKIEDKCPHCGAPADVSHSLAMLQQKNDELANEKQQYEAMGAKIAQIVDHSEDINKLQQLINSLQTEAVVKRTELSSALNNIKRIQSSIDQLKSNNDWSEDEVKLSALEAEMVEKETQANDLEDKIRNHRIMEAALKDDGAKADIIKNYMPYLNDRVNDYLKRMNLFLSIEMTPEFEVEMTSPDRRGQSINSLSTGQQCRIDLAILLAWRDVARISASCSTNILILDEILENMSEQGVSDFLDMWRGLEQSDGVGLYVITQRRSEFAPLFDNQIIYRLVDDRTELYVE